MARSFDKFELPEEVPQGKLILPEVEEKEDDEEKPRGMTLREGHAFKATDLFEVSKRKEESGEDLDMMKSMKSMVMMFKTLRMMMKMMKGLDGDQ